ncbi:MAG: phosphoribosylamine--glycine ligase [Candidatus Micrarchaeota archaeon]
MAEKVLLVGLGSTARADCLADAIAKSAGAELYAYLSHNNPGVLAKAKKVQVGRLEDLAALAKFAKETGASIAVMSPEAALAVGAVDALEEMGVACFGPSKSLARLETSKSFTRGLMQKYGIEGNPEHKSFDSESGLRDYLLSMNSFVIKPDGLSGGKGVKLLGEHLKGIDDSMEYCREILASGGRVIVEEKLEGEEFSLQFITDGKTVVPCPAVQDHKRAYEGDVGQNTGGMGSYSAANGLLPFVSKEDVADAKEITERLAAALYNETGQYYKGVMYGGFMVTASGVKLIEYNARFGDPEIMNVLPLLENDFVEVCRAVASQKLSTLKLSFAPMASVCKYAVPQGYPENPKKNGSTIDLAALEAFSKANSGVKYYLGSVESTAQKNVYSMGTSRAVACVGFASTIEAAEKLAEEAVCKIAGPVRHRKDIGTNALVQKRVAHVNSLKNGNGKAKRNSVSEE